MSGILLIILALFLLLFKIKNDLQDEIKKYLTKKEWEKWLLENASDPKPKIRRIK